MRLAVGVGAALKGARNPDELDFKCIGPRANDGTTMGALIDKLQMRGEVEIGSSAHPGQVASLHVLQTGAEAATQERVKGGLGRLILRGMVEGERFQQMVFGKEVLVRFNNPRFLRRWRKKKKYSRS